MNLAKFIIPDNQSKKAKKLYKKQLLKDQKKYMSLDKLNEQFLTKTEKALEALAEN